MVAVPIPWPSIEFASPIGNSSSRMILQWSAGPSMETVTVMLSLSVSIDMIEISVSDQSGLGLYDVSSMLVSALSFA